MRQIGKAILLASCALGAGLAMAQSVERDGKPVNPAGQAVAQASLAAPIQTAQAGGASGGATTAGAAGGATVGTGTIVVVGVAIAAVAVAASSSSSSSHY